MPRAVIPDFMVLRLGTLADSVSEVHKVEQTFESLLRKRQHDIREPGTPVSLRWALNPILGFPRVPFEVWRRTRQEEPTDPILGAATFTAGSPVTLPNAVIEIRFEASPGAGSLIVEALGSMNRVLPGQRLQFTTAQSGRFRAAGITALRLTGAGSITNIGAIVQSRWANLPDWERIELVGFPFLPDELPRTAYDTAQQQGWELPALSGPDAALLRLRVAAMLQREPLPPGGSLSTPTWGFPNPKVFLEVLRKTVLPQVGDCLATSNDLDPNALQALHRSTRSLDGLRQPGQPPPTDPAQLILTTSQFISLAVQDGPVALGLGFGTIDIPQRGQIGVKHDLMPPGTELARDEYMVTAPFVMGFGKFDLAAIGHRIPAPPAFSRVQVVKTFDNRAPVRDGSGSVAVQLSWAAPLEQTGAAVLVNPHGTPSLLHNTPRPASSGSFQPYLTEHRVAPDGNPPGDLRPGVTMPEEAVPVAGSAVSTYAVAPIDVHGRWGPWQLTSHTTTARDVQKPGLGEVSIQLPAVLPAAGPVAPGCTLTVEVFWDWADRSAQHIEVSGGFCPLGPPPASLSGFGVDSTAASLPTPVTIAFSLTDTPSIAPPPTGAPADVIALLQAATVAEITEPGVAGAPLPAGSAGSQVRRYRLKVPILSVSFAASAEVGYAVSARAAERVRPGELSAPTTPVATRVANPFPAPPPVLPAVTVLWTALPDASGRARTVLTWPAVPGASGYTVWEATETALSHAVGGTAQTGAIRTRAADLKARVAARVNASLGAFSRLNERPLAATSIELVLPGTADTLFAYRMSSITTQNVESARTADIVLVAVPHLETPGTPRLEARASSADGRVTLTIVPGTGLPPDRIAIHRCRRESLSDQIGTMGPPILSVATTSLPTITVPALSGPMETGWQFEDLVTASWTPYFYRCVTFGRHLPDDGIHAGMSPPSGLAMVVVPPAVPPLLATATKSSGTAGTLFTFTTDLPFNASPAGNGKITIAAIAGVTRTVLVALSSPTIPVATPPLVGGATPAAIVAARTATVDGESTVSLLVPAVPINAVSFVVTVTDPLGRSKSLEVV